MWSDFRIGEISCPTKYFPEASSINFRRSCIYGFGVLATALKYRLSRWGIVKSRLYTQESATLPRMTAPMPTMTVAHPIRRVRAA
jgi:hypothetical protein